MELSDFDYKLPPELIAQIPLAKRDSSRLLSLGRDTGKISHSDFGKLPELLTPGDLLVINRTKVIPARLFGTKEKTGGKDHQAVRGFQIDIDDKLDLFFSAFAPEVVRHRLDQPMQFKGNVFKVQLTGFNF